MNEQGCALTKVVRSPEALNLYEMQGARYFCFVQKLRFPCRSKAKVSRQGPQGAGRAQP